jgi:3-dehydroquinate dehydratase-2
VNGIFIFVKKIIMRILIINGPNLNVLGKRQPEIYGNVSFEAYFEKLQNQFAGHELIYYQSNCEGGIIDKLQEEMPGCDAVVINPGAYAHTSIAIADAIRSFATPVIEVHLSNIHARETYRQHSYTAAAAKGLISGFGLDGYAMAIQSVVVG